MASDGARYVIVGAGMHGLSTAVHLARELRATGRGDGSDILVLDKEGVGAGASGIACGIVRNNYFQPAMRRLMAHSVAIWESDPAAYAYQSVGYLQLGPEAMRAGVRQIHAEQRAIGYPSTLVEGEADCRAYMRDLFPDWRAEGVTCVLHERRGGYAHNRASLRGLATRARGEGVRIRTGVRVTGLDRDPDRVRAVRVDDGMADATVVACEQLVVAVGPWIRDLWRMLDLSPTTVLRGPDGRVDPDHPVWSYWLVQEGTLTVDPSSFTDRRGAPPPVVHLDTDAPLHDENGELVTAQPWGIYYKPDRCFGGIQGGGMPRPLAEPVDEVAVDPYGPERSSYTAGPDFARLWTAGLAHCHERFAGAAHRYSAKPSGGLGCFTPDNFPIFDRFRGNVYVIADSNHGYKMIGVGALVAKELLGAPQELLQPFRFHRFARGELHPTSSSPFPWS